MRRSGRSVVDMTAVRGDQLRDLGALLERYRAATPARQTLARRFIDFVATSDDCLDRHRTDSHLTASAWVVSGDGRRVLLTHHKKLGRWLQLGGHADGDRDLARAALREAVEESGIADLALVDGEVFDIDLHFIPSHGAVLGHWHYDVRFIVSARGSEAFVVSDESHALAWRSIGELIDEAGVDVSVRRMARLWLARSSR